MRGFTLLEVTVAVTVLTMMLLAIGGLFDTSSESLHYFSNVSTAETTLRRSIDLIAEDLHNAQPTGITIRSFADADSVMITRAP